MKEDLKIFAYEHIISNADSEEQQAIKKTCCILYVNKFANGIKYIYFYSSDLFGFGEEDFQLEYDIEYSNGDFQHGDAIISTKELIDAFGFEDYNSLKLYFANKYVDDINAWRKIIMEIQGKGLSPNIDENEGGNNYMTNL